MNQKEFIIVIGPQGSGKSTQGRLLAEKLGYKFISSGDLLRQLKDEKNPLGEKLAKYWIKGELVPDDLIEDLLYGMFEKETIKGFVLDGFPRNLEQFKSFISVSKMNNWIIKNVVYVKVGEEECIKRLRKRVDIEKREDETDSAIKNRLKIYKEKTNLLLNKFKEMDILIEIDGERTVEEIQKDIIKYFVSS